MPNVEGTGFEGRDRIIRAHVRTGMPVYLVREKYNTFDPHAIAVCVDTPKFLCFGGRKKIGYIDKSRAAQLAPKLDAGEQFEASVISMYANMKFPRVTIHLKKIAKSKRGEK